MWDEEERLMKNMKEKVTESKSQIQELEQQRRKSSSKSRGRSKSHSNIRLHEDKYHLDDYQI